MILTCFRTHNDVPGDMENGFENGKGCECYTCNEIGHTVRLKISNLISSLFVSSVHFLYTHFFQFIKPNK